MPLQMCTKKPIFALSHHHPQQHLHHSLKNVQTLQHHQDHDYQDYQDHQHRCSHPVPQLFLTIQASSV